MMTLLCVFVLAIVQVPASPKVLLAEAQALLDAPETPARMRRVEAILTELRRLEDFDPDKSTLDTRFGMHTEMLERYRTAGDLTRLRPHAEWLVALEHRAHAFQEPGPVGSLDADKGSPRPLDVAYLRAIRKRHGFAFLAARIDVARAALAGGDRAKAIWWLETGERCLTDIPGAVNALKAERDRIRKMKVPD